MAEQSKDQELAAYFKPIAKDLQANEEQITKELIEVQGQPMDIGGYYNPDPAKETAAMRPSKTFNAIID